MNKRQRKKAQTARNLARKVFTAAYIVECDEGRMMFRVPKEDDNLPKTVSKMRVFLKRHKRAIG